MTIMGNASEDEEGKYEITIITALYKEGEEPIGCGTKMGTFNTAEIEDIMSIEGNAQMILDDFLESVQMIYSGNLTKQ